MLTTESELRKSTSERGRSFHRRRRVDGRRGRGRDVSNTRIRYHNMDKRLFILTNSVASSAWDPFRARGWKVVEVHNLDDLKAQVFVSATYRKLIGVAVDWDCDNETRDVLSRTFHRIFFERALKNKVQKS